MACPFQAAKLSWLAEREFALFRCNDMEQDHFVLLMAKLIQGGSQLIEFVETIAEGHQQAAAFERGSNLTEHLGQAGFLPGLTGLENINQSRKILWLG